MPSMTASHTHTHMSHTRYLSLRRRWISWADTAEKRPIRENCRQSLRLLSARFVYLIWVSQPSISYIHIYVCVCVYSNANGTHRKKRGTNKASNCESITKVQKFVYFLFSFMENANNNVQQQTTRAPRRKEPVCWCEGHCCTHDTPPWPPPPLMPHSQHSRCKLFSCCLWRGL